MAALAALPWRGRRPATRKTASVCEGESGRRKLGGGKEGMLDVARHPSPQLTMSMSTSSLYLSRLFSSFSRRFSMSTCLALTSPVSAGSCSAAKNQPVPRKKCAAAAGR